MKKSVGIIILIIIIVLVLGVVWCYDNTRIIEKPSDEIMQIAREKDGDNISGFPYAYSLELTDTEITLTYYQAEDAVKSIHVFYITDGVISSTYYEKHYITKLGAKLDSNTILNKKIKNNIVSGQLEGDTYAIGENANDYYNRLMKAYSHLVYID